MKIKKFSRTVLTVVLVLIVLVAVSGCLSRYPEVKPEKGLIEEIVILRDEEHQIPGTNYTLILRDVSLRKPGGWGSSSTPTKATIEFHDGSDVEREIFGYLCPANFREIKIFLESATENSVKLSVYQI